MIVNKNVDI